MNQVDWNDRSTRPLHQPTRIPRGVQNLICRLRRQLAQDDLGFNGAAAVQAAFQSERPTIPAPSLATINRILHAHGFMDQRRRIRSSAPPLGWYLPDCASSGCELDSFDLIEGLGLGEAGLCDVFTGRALWGCSRLAVPAPRWSARAIVSELIRYWHQHGLPTFAQFDNDMRFHGSRHPPGSLGRVIRFCLGLGIVPVFAPPRESGFQAAIENFNGIWQRCVWQRFHFDVLADVRLRSERFIRAYVRLLRNRGHDERAPCRRLIEPTRPNYSQIPNGKVIFLRRTNDNGFVEVLNHRVKVDPNWPHRLLRCELNLPDQTMRCYRLRRRAPSEQPLVATVSVACCLEPIRLGRMD